MRIFCLAEDSHVIISLIFSEKKSMKLFSRLSSAAVVVGALTHKAPITTAADDIHKYFFHCFSEKIRLDASSESSAGQRIHMKNQVLFSSKHKSKKLKCRLLQFLFGALRIKG